MPPNNEGNEEGAGIRYSKHDEIGPLQYRAQAGSDAQRTSDSILAARSDV